MNDSVPSKLIECWSCRAIFLSTTAPTLVAVTLRFRFERECWQWSTRLECWSCRAIFLSTTAPTLVAVTLRSRFERECWQWSTRLLSLLVIWDCRQQHFLSGRTRSMSNQIGLQSMPNISAARWEDYAQWRAGRTAIISVGNINCESGPIAIHGDSSLAKLSNHRRIRFDCDQWWI
jgi:hypothetical protein